MGRPKKSSVENPKAKRKPSAPKQVQDAIERHRADEAVAAKEEKTQKLKTSLRATTSAICLDLEKTLGQQFSPGFVKAMSEASYHYAESVVKDVEAFRKHAKRAAPNVDDVKLCTRRSKSLQRALGEFSDALVTSRVADNVKPTKAKEPVAAAVDCDEVEALENEESDLDNALFADDFDDMS